MDNLDIIALAGTIAIVGVGTLVLGFAGFMIFRAVSQSRSMSYKVDESLSLGREGVELAKQSLEAQREIIQLLREIRDGQN